MMPDPLAKERLSLALAARAYTRREVRLARPDLGSATHWVASRQGLFAASRGGVHLMVHGMFFGLTRRGKHLYLFESCDRPHARTRRGRVVRLTIEARRIVDAIVLVEGLDNGGHQLDFVGDLLCLLDTYNQRILAFSIDGAAVAVPQPLPAAPWDQWNAGYAHANSILQVRGHILIMLHNGMPATTRASSILVLDDRWRPVGQWPLPAGGCHDIACAPDGALLTCGSLAGELLALDGRRLRISPQMTRGLSVSADEIVVGASQFSTRRDRMAAMGSLSFLTGDWTMAARIELESAPTCLLRIDDPDYGVTQPTDLPSLPATKLEAW